MRHGELFLVVTLSLFAANAQSYNGAELREELQLWTLIHSNKATNSDFAKLGHALGYIDGFSDAYLQEQSRGARAAQDEFTFCLPKEFVLADLQQTAKSYLERHREKYVDRAPASGVLGLAFHE